MRETSRIYSNNIGTKYLAYKMHEIRVLIIWNY